MRSQFVLFLFLMKSAATITVTAATNPAAAMTNGNSPADCTVPSVGCGETESVGCVAGLWVGEAEVEEDCGD